jgi:hypothetical protein
MAAVDVHDGTAMLAYPVRGQLIQVAKMAVDGASGIIMKRIRANIVEACEFIRYQQILPNLPKTYTHFKRKIPLNP